MQNFDRFDTMMAKYCPSNLCTTTEQYTHRSKAIHQKIIPANDLIVKLLHPTATHTLQAYNCITYTYCITGDFEWLNF